MISKDKIQEILRSKGIVIEKIATDPRVYEIACAIAYKSIPIPLRWFIGKKKVSKLVWTIKDKGASFIGRKK